MGRKSCKIIILAAISIFILLSFLRCCTGALFFENCTSSAPQGIYVKAFGRIAYDDYVVVALDRDVAALKKGYLLLKRVKGFPGDVYIVGNGWLDIRGQSFPVKRVDGLPHLAKGSYIVPKGKYLLLNEAEDSFDSRYLGPMSQEQVRSKVMMLLPYQMLGRLLANSR